MKDYEFIDRAINELDDEGVLADLTDQQVEALRKDAEVRSAKRRERKSQE